MGGAAGHDSLEDARATGELVRWKVKAEWRRLKGEGWEVGVGGFVPPMGVEGSVGVEGEKVGEVEVEIGFTPGAGEKRKRPAFLLGP